MSSAEPPTLPEGSLRFGELSGLTRQGPASAEGLPRCAVPVASRPGQGGHLARGQPSPMYQGTATWQTPAPLPCGGTRHWSPQVEAAVSLMTPYT